MTNNLLEREDFDRLSPLPIHTIELTDSALQWATEVSLMSSEVGLDGEDEQWEVFLQGLAIAGFNQWLEEGAIPLLGKHISSHTVNDPIANVQVGNYKLYVAAINALDTETIEIPLSSFEHSTRSENSVSSTLAHLYILVEVQAEIDQVCILAGLRKERLLQQITLSTVQAQQAISIPLSYFDIEPEQVLLTLSCLEPVAPPVTLQNAIVTSVQETRTAIAQNLINAGVWLQNQIDSVAEQMNWALLPPISTAMRPVRESVDTALEVLASQGVQLPLQARGIGGPLLLGACVCQIYAWAWPVETVEERTTAASAEPEWALFLLLGAQVGEVLPAGIQLQVSEGDELLAQEILAATSSEAYLYTQVQGTQTEQFVARVVLPSGVAVTLPAFGFEPA